MAESSVPISGVGTVQLVRNLLVTTQNTDGTLSAKLEQVVAIADSNGNLIDLNLAPIENVQTQLMVDIRKELMIQNELLVLLLTSGAPIDLEKEYRNDKIYQNPYTPSP